MSNKCANASVEAAIARLASRQHGVLSLAQLTAEADRARDARLKLMGFDVVRFTWRQIVDGASAAATTLRALLG